MAEALEAGKSSVANTPILAVGSQGDQLTVLSNQLPCDHSTSHHLQVVIVEPAIVVLAVHPTISAHLPDVGDDGLTTPLVQVGYNGEQFGESHLYSSQLLSPLAM
jgi:hypothetical protein